MPYYYTNSGTPSQPITVDPINGTLIKALTPQANDYSSLWAIDDSLAVGDRLYTDRDNMTYTQIPDTLIGAETIVTPCDAKKITGDLATFTANGNITVYIALDNRVTSIPSWLSGYTRTYQTVTSSTDVVYDIYSKEFKSGENVTLGTNGQSSSCTGYTVFVKKNIPAPINGSRVLGLAANENALPDLWNIDTDIQVGDLIYTDRDGVTYTELPRQLVGAEAIVTPCDAKKIDSDLASFTAGRDITVYVIYDSRITASTPAWLTSYTRTDMTVKNVQDVIYNVYSRDFRAGEKVTLGTNGQSSSCTGYSVIVTDIYKEAPVLMGDVNMDGKFTISDVVEVNKWLNNAGQLVNSKAADVNKDGSIDRNDLDMMMNAIVGKTKF